MGCKLKKKALTAQFGIYKNIMATKGTYSPNNQTLKTKKKKEALSWLTSKKKKEEEPFKVQKNQLVRKGLM